MPGKEFCVRLVEGTLPHLLTSTIQLNRGFVRVDADENRNADAADARRFSQMILINSYTELH